MHKDLKHLQKALGLPFADQTLLKQAFTHSSFVNEHRTSGVHDNERLEFLGDAVLQLMVSEWLFTVFPNRPEGELTKLRASIVCEPSLVRFAEDLRFGDYVRLGKGEELTGGRSRPALLADVFESFLAALYMDKGLETVRSFLQQHLFPKLAGQESMQVSDYKTRLQELSQQLGCGTAEYRIVDEQGPAHDRIFSAVAQVQGETLGTGTGRSKKEAEQQAAAQALARLQADMEK